MALDSSTWDALKELRESGQKPTLPVIVTTKRHLPYRLQGVGCMVILHEAGKAMPVALLESLDVIFFFDRCDLVVSVWKLCSSKGVKMASTKVWCACDGSLSVAPLLCESYADAMQWLEGINAA